MLNWSVPLFPKTSFPTTGAASSVPGHEGKRCRSRRHGNSCPAVGQKHCWRPSLLGWESVLCRLEAIATRLEATVVKDHVLQKHENWTISRTTGFDPAISSVSGFESSCKTMSETVGQTRLS